jgi:hypothetical protein
MEDGEFTQDERMWVNVEEKTPHGYKGILDNEPTTHGSLCCGAVIEFEDQHIMDIYRPEKYIEKNYPATRIIDKRKPQ